MEYKKDIPKHPDPRIQVLDLYKRKGPRYRRHWAVRCLCKRYIFVRSEYIKRGAYCRSCGGKNGQRRRHARSTDR